jgi:hypothetical protein
MNVSYHEIDAVCNPILMKRARSQKTLTVNQFITEELQDKVLP